MRRIRRVVCSDLRVGVLLGLGERPGDVGSDVVDLRLVAGEQKPCEDCRRGQNGERLRRIAPCPGFRVEGMQGYIHRGVGSRVGETFGGGCHRGDAVEARFTYTVEKPGRR